MNRKITLFIVTALLTSLVWVSSVLAAPEAPTVSMEVCVGVQGGRAIGNDESITYSLDKTSGGGGATYAGADTAAIQAAPTSKACFDVVAEPGETYDLSVSGADTLTETLNGVQINSGASNDLTASVALREGDANGDKNIEFADFNILNTQYDASTAQAGASADFNEDTFVEFADFTLLSTNYNTTSNRQGRSFVGSDRGTEGTAIVDEGPESYANLAVNEQFMLSIAINNPTGENIRSGLFHIRYDVTKYTFLGIKVGSGFGDCNTGCDFDSSQAPVIDAVAGTANIAVAKQGGAALVQNSIRAVELYFQAVQADTNVIGAKVFEIYSGDSDVIPRNGSQYGTDARAELQFANCPLPAGLPCGSPSAIALTSSDVASSQSITAIVLVFSATILVIGSRLAVLNKRK